jgi:5-methylcytosine-specific restriction enzyme subunit McrC
MDNASLFEKKMPQIPIDNLYFLLCYAWDKLSESKRVGVSVEAGDSWYNLLARVLLRVAQWQLKRGLPATYVPQKGLYAGVRGRINFRESLARPYFQIGQSMCETAEWSENTLSNQILKKTIYFLKKSPEVSLKIQSQFDPLLRRLTGVSDLTFSPSIWARAHRQSMDTQQQFLLHLCEMLVKNLLPHPQSGSYQFMAFWEDPIQMASLFEAFIRNFYKEKWQNDPQVRVKRELIRWQMTGDASRLPQMQTDVSIWLPGSKVIIETKFYRETFQRYFDTPKLHSTHLYQLHTYLQHQPDPQCVGILLYPTVRQEVCENYTFGQHRLWIRTVNLAKPWPQIVQFLTNLLDENQLYVGKPTQ